MNIVKKESVILSLLPTAGPKDQFRLPFPRSQTPFENALVSAILLLFSPILLAEPAVSPADPLAEALPILQAKYPDFKDLDYKEGDKLADLVARSEGKISLNAPDSGLPSSSAANVITTLPDNILYWRLASFTPEKTWLDTGGRLQQLAPSTTGIILDLRSTSDPDNYRGAQQILLFLAPHDHTTFRSLTATPEQTPVILEGGQYSFHCPIAVLMNNHTTGAAEALATCLKADGALIIGRPTAGKMGVFEEQKLSGGEVLRYFVYPVNLPVDPNAVFKIAQQPLPWNQPLQPDIALTVTDQLEKNALMLIARNRIAEVIEESPARHRMSEAALVQGDDPEWDDYLASLEKKPFLLSLPAVHDKVLIRALDSLKAIQLAQRPPLAQPGGTTAPQASASIQ